MANQAWLSHSVEETVALGKHLAADLQPPLIILLAGELGAGKTTLAKGIISGLGAAREQDVTSPTFTLVHFYRNRSPIFHVDLFRVEGGHDLASLGLEDMFVQPAIVLIEWPEKLSFQTNWPLLRVYIDHVNTDSRQIYSVGPEAAITSSLFARGSNK